MTTSIDPALQSKMLAFFLATEIFAEMICHGGVGVTIWVDNVCAELRHEANFIVASNVNDGVAEVLERFILN